MTMQLPHIFTFDLPIWQSWLAEHDEPKYRGEQIFSWLHRHNAITVDEMVNLPKTLRQKLQDAFVWPSESHQSFLQAGDGTAKFLYKLSKDKVVEAVWLPTPNRQSICVSMQSGCTLNCSFCATGKIKFRGNLDVGEILSQVYLTQKKMKRRVTNVVFMGMGEPFYNYDAVLKAADMLNDPQGLNIGARHITISTSGVLPGIERFIQEGRPYGLALSLHAVFSDKRAAIMPIEKKYPVSEILSYIKTNRHLLRKNRFTFEYIMIHDFNLSSDDAQELARLAKSLQAKVNLIPLNTSYPGLVRPSEDEIDLFLRALEDFGVKAMNRRSSGQEIQAACGMLAGQTLGV